MEKNNIIFEGKYALSLSLLPHVPEPPFIQTIALPIEIIGMERVVEYMLKSSKKTLTSTSTITWEVSKKLCSNWMQDMEKWFGRWKM